MWVLALYILGEGSWVHLTLRIVCKVDPRHKERPLEYDLNPTEFGRLSRLRSLEGNPEEKVASIHYFTGFLWGLRGVEQSLVDLLAGKLVKRAQQGTSKREADRLIRQLGVEKRAAIPFVADVEALKLGCAKLARCDGLQHCGEAHSEVRRDPRWVSQLKRNR